MGLNAERMAPAEVKRDAAALHLPPGGEQPIGFSQAHDIALQKQESLPEHPNGMRFFANGEEEAPCAARTR